MLSLAQVVVLLTGVRVATGVGVNIPLVAPTTAPTVSKSLVSFSLEQDRWVDWAGTLTARNEFAFNTWTNLKTLTGEPPWIRIGANSEDRTNFEARVQYSEATFPPSTPTVPYIEASSIRVGDGYYQLAQNLPFGTHVIWGVNFRQNNLTAATANARSIAKAFASIGVRSQGIVLDYLQIGNEPDLYKTFPTAEAYVSAWTTFVGAVAPVAGITQTSYTKFIAGALAASSRSETTGLSPQSMFKAGLLDESSGPLIKAFSQHRYSGSFCTGNGDLMQNLMVKSSIRGNLTLFRGDIAAVKAKGLSYVLGETNSYACHGAPGVSNAAGAALWTLDYTLFATQLGIERVFFHQGIGFKYNLVQPITLTRSVLNGQPLNEPLLPHVQPQYYAAIIIAEAIGKSGQTKVVELSLDDARLAGYAFYEAGVLKRAVFINSSAYYKEKTRYTKHIDFGFAGEGAPTSMVVKRLFIRSVDDENGLTWGGQTYDTADGKVAGTVKTTTAAVSGGLDISQTEVVMVSFA